MFIKSVNFPQFDPTNVMFVLVQSPSSLILQSYRCLIHLVILCNIFWNQFSAIFLLVVDLNYSRRIYDLDGLLNLGQLDEMSCPLFEPFSCLNHLINC